MPGTDPKMSTKVFYDAGAEIAARAGLHNLDAFDRTFLAVWLLHEVVFAENPPPFSKNASEELASTLHDIAHEISRTVIDTGPTIVGFIYADAPKP